MSKRNVRQRFITVFLLLTLAVVCLAATAPVQKLSGLVVYDSSGNVRWSQTAANLSGFNASGVHKINMDTVTGNVNTSGTFTGSGAGLTSLNAGNISAGTLGTARGGTGLSTIGTAGQVLRVNSGATGLEYGTVSSGGVADPTGNGIVAKTGSGTAAARTITGSGSDITVTNGDGVSGNPTISVGSNIPKLDAANTFTNDLVLSMNGSTTAAPRRFGFSNYSVGEASRLDMSGANDTGIQTAWGQQFQIFSYSNTRIGGLLTGTTPTFVAHDAGLPAVSIYTPSSQIPLSVEASPGSIIQQWIDGSTVVGSVSKLGIASFNYGVFSSKDVNGIPLVLKGFTGQSATLQEWQNVSGTVLAAVAAAGEFAVKRIGVNTSTPPTSGAYLQTPDAAITNTTAGNVPLTVKGASGQTANLTEWKNSSNTTVASVDKDGKLSAAAITTAEKGQESIPTADTVVTVSTTAITATDTVVLTYAGSSNGGKALWADNIVAGTSFDIHCSTAVSDTTTVNWAIIH